MSRSREESLAPVHSNPPGILSSLLVGACCLAAYLALAPAVPGDKDSGEFTLVLATCGLAHPTGYPLYTLAGSVFVRALHALGMGWAQAANAFSALGGALAMAGLHALSARLLHRAMPSRAPGLFALLPVLALALHPVWTQETTLAEVNSWHLAWVMLAALCALGLGESLARADRAGRSAAGAAAAWGLVVGLGVAHHATSVLVSLPLSLALLMLAARHRRLGPGAATGAFVGLAAGLASLGYVAWRAYHPAAEQWPELQASAAGIVAHLSGSQFRSFLGRFAPSAIQQARLSQWVYPFLLPALAGAAAAWRPPASGATAVRHALGAAVVLQTGYAFLYGVSDPSPYFLTALALGLALATEGLGSWRPARHVAVAPVLTLALAVTMAPGLRAAQTRAEAYAQLDDLVRRMWGAIPPGRAFVVWDDDMASRLRALQQLEGSRTDLVVIQPRHLSHPQPRERFSREWGFDPIANWPDEARGEGASTERGVRLAVESVVGTINDGSSLPVYVFRPDVPSLRLLQKRAPEPAAVTTGAPAR